VAGYSGTPLPKKLGIQAGHRVALIGAPNAFETSLGDLPERVTFGTGIPRSGRANIVIWFVTRRAVFESRQPMIRSRMAPDTALWVAWPKKASGVATDMNENVIREVALPTGLVDNKVCAIDETWSGLRLVIRRELRPR
jgi:hypothetical protein